MREGRGSALDYFSLPVSEYNLLDGSMISRDAADENLFHLKLPVSEVSKQFADLPAGTKLLDPEFDVRVESRGGEVAMAFLNARFGDPEIDERIRLAVDVSMRAGPDQKVTATVRIDSGLQVPAPVSRAPAALLNSIAGLVANMILGAILPNFLVALEKDFQQWQSGKSLEERWKGSTLEGRTLMSSSDFREGDGPAAAAAGPAAAREAGGEAAGVVEVEARAVETLDAASSAASELRWAGEE